MIEVLAHAAKRGITNGKILQAAADGNQHVVKSGAGVLMGMSLRSFTHPANYPASRRMGKAQRTHRACN